MNLKNVKVFTSKFVGTGPSSYKKIIYRAAVLQWLSNTALKHSDKYTNVEHALTLKTLHYSTYRIYGFV